MPLKTDTLLFIVFVLTGCSSPPLEVRPDGLIEFPDAQNAQEQVMDMGNNALSYTLNRTFPPDEVATQIAQLLEGNGWNRGGENIIDKVLFIFDWEAEGQKTQDDNAYQWDEVELSDRTLAVWHGTWRNERGEVVVYTLSYEFNDQQQPKTISLNVNSQFLPKPMIDKMQDILQHKSQFVNLHEQYSQGDLTTSQFQKQCQELGLIVKIEKSIQDGVEVSNMRISFSF
jgi:hypothetical protein